MLSERYQSVFFFFLVRVNGFCEWVRKHVKHVLHHFHFRKVSYIFASVQFCLYRLPQQQRKMSLRIRCHIRATHQLKTLVKDTCQNNRKLLIHKMSDRSRFINETKCWSVGKKKQWQWWRESERDTREARLYNSRSS